MLSAIRAFFKCRHFFEGLYSVSMLASCAQVAVMEIFAVFIHVYIEINFDQLLF